MKMIPCDKYEKCKEKKLFQPFCYEIGPSEDARFQISKNHKYQRSGYCWAILTGKIYWREIRDND
jgi:hypothetical protein